MAEAVPFGSSPWRRFAGKLRLVSSPKSTTDRSGRVSGANGPGGRSRNAYSGLREIAGLAAAVLSIGLGIGLGPATKEPAVDYPFREALTPLTDAPIPPGTALVLVPPPETPLADAKFWLYEACWRRPDVLWSLAQEWPLAERPTAGVAVRPTAVPPGWHEAWRRGDLRYARHSGAK